MIESHIGATAASHFAAAMRNVTTCDLDAPILMEMLVFENEGHDVLKYENRVKCYNAIADFFAKYLKP